MERGRLGILLAPSALRMLTLPAQAKMGRQLFDLKARHTHQAKTNEQRLAYAKPIENDDQHSSVQDDRIFKKLPRKPYEDKNRRHEKGKGQ